MEKYALARMPLVDQMNFSTPMLASSGVWSVEEVRHFQNLSNLALCHLTLKNIKMGTIVKMVILHVQKMMLNKLTF